VWIYLVGPLAGAVLGAAIWAYLVDTRKPAVA
jgi:glycerol uptake facilitator-like aquaporin